MALFKKTNVKIFAKPTQKVTPDVVYWKQLSVPVILKEFGAIDYIDFSPIEPHYFAVTCSVRVQIYNPITKLVHKTLSRFRETAYGGTFRSDGQLLCVGGQESHIRLFDVNTKSVLRVFKGHNGPVHRCYFTQDKVHIASFSDDATVCLWDVPTEAKLVQLTGHEDFIRAGAVSPVSPTTILSGCYDKKIRMFDTRTSTEPVFTVDHGSPVESVLFLPSGGVFISAGGTEIRVWDAFAGGRLLARASHHHKTITSLCLASNSTRLFSGSLDRHVKVYDVSNYKVVHNIDFPNSIISLGVSANDDTLAVGTVDGIVSVSRRELSESGEQLVKPSKKRASYKYAGDKYRIAPTIDMKVTRESKDLSSKHDVLLRKFQYLKALQTVLRPYLVNKTPQVTATLLKELIRREALQRVLNALDEKNLNALLKYLIKYMGESRFTLLFIDVTNILINAYEDKLELQTPYTIELFKKLLKRLKEEEELTKELLKLGGAIEMILAASSHNTEPQQRSDKPLMPSVTAQQEFILSV